MLLVLRSGLETARAMAGEGSADAHAGAVILARSITGGTRLTRARTLPVTRTACILYRPQPRARIFQPRPQFLRPPVPPVQVRPETWLGFRVQGLLLSALT